MVKMVQLLKQLKTSNQTSYTRLTTFVISPCIYNILNYIC